MALGINAIAELLEPTVQGLGFDLWGVEYIAHGKASVLRIFIDAEAGISVEDCARVSHQVSGVLDVEDPLPGEYQLEVSSPGLDRPFFKLSQYAAYVGQEIAVKLKMPLFRSGNQPGRQQFKGCLLAIEDAGLKFRVGEDEEWLVSFEQIKKAHLIPSF